MYCYQLNGPGSDTLSLVEREAPSPGPGEVLVRLRAASLNYLDLVVASGALGQDAFPLIPVTDGAGDVAELGAGVIDFEIGDRVVPHFNLDRLVDGRAASAPTLFRGVNAPGSAAEFVAVPASALTRIPAALSYAEAATLPIAATTALSALQFGRIGIGATVAVLGTGGVSLFALQLAKASGARVIVTSSSDEKLERARALGADVTVNYRSTPHWDEEILRVTDGRGVDLVIDPVGTATFPQSLAVAARGGAIAVVGFISGWELQVPIMTIQQKNLKIEGTSTGSMQVFNEVVRVVAAAEIKPVIDKVYSVHDLPAAYELLKSGGHFGKIVVTLDFSER